MGPFEWKFTFWPPSLSRRVSLVTVPNDDVLRLFTFEIVKEEVMTSLLNTSYDALTLTYLCVSKPIQSKVHFQIFKFGITPIIMIFM